MDTKSIARKKLQIVYLTILARHFVHKNAMGIFVLIGLPRNKKIFKKDGFMKKIIVIGAGASGLVAAIFAARKGNDVIILEKIISVVRKF